MTALSDETPAPNLDLSDLEVEESAPVDDAPEVEAADDAPATEVEAAPEAEAADADADGDALPTVEATLSSLADRLQSDAEPVNREMLERFAEDGGIDGLDPVAKTLVLEAHAAVAASRRELDAERAKFNERVAKTQAELRKQVAAFRQERAAFARLVRNPELQDSISKGLAIADKDIDPYTEKGRNAAITRAVAQQMDQFTRPLTDKLGRFDREQRVAAFLEANPDAAKHQTAIAALLKERREAGRPLELEDAASIVLGQIANREAQERLKRRRAARQAGNSATRGSSRGAGSGLNAENVEATYKRIVAEQGVNAAVQWLADNPRAETLLNQRLGL